MISHEELIELGFEKSNKFNAYSLQKNDSAYILNLLDYSIWIQFIDEISNQLAMKPLGKATTKEQLENLINALKELE